jgi:hypothetical protein
MALESNKCNIHTFTFLYITYVIIKSTPKDGFYHEFVVGHFYPKDEFSPLCLTLCRVEHTPLSEERCGKKRVFAPGVKFTPGGQIKTDR